MVGDLFVHPAEVETRGEAPVGARRALDRLAFVDVPLLLVVVPLAVRLSDDAHASAGDGLAEQVVGADLDGGVLPRKVVGAIRGGRHGEGRQVVAADREPRGPQPARNVVAVQLDLDHVGAELRVRRDLPLHAGDAEARRRRRGAEDLVVALGAYRHREGGARERGRPYGRIVEGEASHVQRLAGLIEPLVGRHQESRACRRIAQVVFGGRDERAAPSRDFESAVVDPKALRDREAERRASGAIGPAGGDEVEVVDVVVLAREVERRRDRDVRDRKMGRRVRREDPRLVTLAGANVPGQLRGEIEDVVRQL